jgi:hypothetical protein
MGDSLMRLFPMAGWVAASQKNAPVNPPAPANGTGRKEEAAYQCGLKSESEEERHLKCGGIVGTTGFSGARWLIQINWSVLIPFAKERRRR